MRKVGRLTEWDATSSSTSESSDSQQHSVNECASRGTPRGNSDYHRHKHGQKISVTIARELASGGHVPRSAFNSSEILSKTFQRNRTAGWGQRGCGGMRGEFLVGRGTSKHRQALPRERFFTSKRTAGNECRVMPGWTVQQYCQKRLGDKDTNTKIPENIHTKLPWQNYWYSSCVLILLVFKRGSQINRSGHVVKTWIWFLLHSLGQTRQLNKGQ